MLFCLLLLWFQNPTAAAKEHASRGLELTKSGQLQSAEAELREAVRLVPSDAFSLALLGVVLGRQQKLTEADIYLERALKVDPADITSRFNLAVNQFRLGKLAESKSNLERVLKDQPGTPPAILVLGTVLERLGDYERAAGLLETVPDLVRRQPESVAVLARSYCRTGRREKEREALDWLAPAGPQAVFLGGKTAAQCGDFEYAQKLFRSIHSTFPDKAALTYEIALVDYNTGQFGEARTALQPLIAAGTRDAKIFNLLSWCYHREKRPDDAVAAMKQAIALEPAAEINYDHLAQILMEEGNFTGAYETAKQAIALAPGSASAYKLRGHTESRLGFFKQALESYIQAEKLGSEDADLLLGLGSVQQKLFQPAAAAATFERGIARYSSDAQLYQAYGRMLLGPGPKRDQAAESRAVTLLKKALSLDHSLPDAHYDLGNFLLESDKAADALPHLEAAAKLDPASGRIHLALANCYRRLGRSGDAQHEFELFKKLGKQEGREAN